jgi:hypothetical protein
VTTLLSVSFAVLLPALAGVLLLALLAATALLVVLALLALDVLLERNGVDRRAGIRRAWDRLRRPGPGHPAADRGAAPSPRRAEGDAQAGPTPRIPFSARRPTRGTRSPEPERVADPPAPPAPPASSRTAVVPEPAPAPSPAPDEPAVAPPVAAESPTPAADAVTEVLAVERQPAPRTRAVRTARVAPTRTPDPAPEPGTEPPADRDSAIDRLFAPLLESDRTEPLPRAARPARKPRDQD